VGISANNSMAVDRAEVTLDPPMFSGFDPIADDVRSQLIPDGLPQFYPATPNQTTERIVVCIHGFTGTAYEAAPIAEACAQAGLDAVTILLPGHGYVDPETQRHQFARITAQGLLNAARLTLQRARDQYQQVGVFGISMGGAIALQMAAEQRVDACAVAAAALRLSAKAEILIPLLSWAKFYLPSELQHDFYLPAYDFYHSRSLRALWQVSRQARANLSEITCPVYAAHSHYDTTIPPVVMEQMQREISSLKEAVWLDQSNHVLTRDKDSETIKQQVAEFMVRHLSERSWVQ
jgi:carboxylesterase